MLVRQVSRQLLRAKGVSISTLKSSEAVPAPLQIREPADGGHRLSAIGVRRRNLPCGGSRQAGTKQKDRPDLPNPGVTPKQKSVHKRRNGPVAEPGLFQPYREIFFSHAWIWILRQGGIGLLRYASIKLKEGKETSMRSRSRHR